MLADGADRASFEADLEAMRRLAAAQPGHRWARVARCLTDPLAYVVVSEWDRVEDVRAWEHHPGHEEVMRRWEGRYGEPLVHRRFVPWQRPLS